VPYRVLPHHNPCQYLLDQLRQPTTPQLSLQHQLRHHSVPSHSLPHLSSQLRSHSLPHLYSNRRNNSRLQQLLNLQRFHSQLRRSLLSVQPILANVSSIHLKRQRKPLRMLRALSIGNSLTNQLQVLNSPSSLQHQLRHHSVPSHSLPHLSSQLRSRQ
jgi:hypothetical protein